MHRKAYFAATAALVSLVWPAVAQQPIVYPAKGQNQQQQMKDMGECQVWATQTTGIDPARVAQQAANQPPPPGPAEPEPGSGARGAVKGAVVGGVIGGIGGRGGEGAAAGAVVGGIAARRSSRREAEARNDQYAQQQYYAQQQAQGQIATYNRAYAACMSGRGYTVN